MSQKTIAQEVAESMEWIESMTDDERERAAVKALLDAGYLKSPETLLTIVRIVHGAAQGESK